ncbi:MAG: pentapeptide repeat-containing protein [Desulfobacter postgatei]|uniref:pentapeptide repeat-containing protein n=1 Tax=Desulfobacter postgatei TaxID=2293 RepID=UPI0023F32DFF|nr:pentapeptide repeat-containing protein [Desulfobacter postgatei]MDD4274014.1 pentapeptide repeat-containing protein [Desulfobacter postgatei]
MIFDSDIVKEVGQTRIPYEPKVDFCWEGLLSPWSYFCKPIIQSLLSNDAFYKRFVIRNKEKLIIGYKPIASADEFVLMMTELWKTKLCNANLSNMDLSNVDLSNAELSNADFTNTNLSNAKLMNANLSNANFDGAKLIDANLINTNLTNAESFSGNFYKANFLSADLSDASFIDANLTDANFTEAILSNTNIDGANLSNACLEYVKFSKNPEQQFSQVKTLYGIKGLPPNLETLLKRNEPELFIQPKE